MPLRLPWLALALIVGGELAAAALLPKAVSWDPSYGMLAAQHYARGQSPNLWTRVEPAPDNLEIDVERSEPWWSPSYQGLPWLIHLSGLSWGHALNVLTVLCLAVGLGGWAIYFKKVTTSWRTAVWLCVALACARYTALFTMVYPGGDLLLWTAAPWLIVLNALAMERNSARAAAAAGVLSPGIVVLKYSGLFLVAGVALVWLASAIRRTVPARLTLLWCGAAIVVSPIIVAFAFPEARPHSALVIRPLAAVSSFAYPGLGAFDLESLLYKLFEGFAPSRARGAGAVVGIAASIAMLTLAIKTRLQWPTSKIGVLGLAAAVTDMAALAMSIFIGQPIAPQARLGRVAGLLLCPLVVKFLLGPAAPGQWLLRRSLLAMVVVVPALYGLVAGTTHLVARARMGPAVADAEFVVAGPLSDGTNHEAFSREIVSILPDDQTILYTTYPQLAFAVPSRRTIVVEAVELYSASELAQQRYRSTSRLSVGLLLPSSFANTAKLSAIQRSFVDVSGWSFALLKSDPKWALWVGE